MEALKRVLRRDAVRNFLWCPYRGRGRIAFRSLTVRYSTRFQGMCDRLYLRLARNTRRPARAHGARRARAWIRRARLRRGTEDSRRR